jgi:hypothetical protein
MTWMGAVPVRAVDEMSDDEFETLVSRWPTTGWATCLVMVEMATRTGAGCSISRVGP